jgi:hypothetical protein
MTSDFDLKGKASVQQPSDIIFRVGSDEIKEIIKLCANGDIFVKGRLIKSDEELVQGMKDFLAVSYSENDKLRRQVSIYEKAFESIMAPYKDIGLGCYHEEIARAALEEGRK